MDGTVEQVVCHFPGIPIEQSNDTPPVPWGQPVWNAKAPPPWWALHACAGRHHDETFRQCRTVAWISGVKAKAM
jgi:hypothetical protein